MPPDFTNDQSAPQQAPPNSGGKGMATASLVLGLLSILFGPISGIVGIILGWIGLQRPEGKGMAKVGLVLSLFFSAAWIALGVYMYLEEEEFKKETVHYKTIWIAIEHHETQYASLPLPYHHRAREFGLPPNSREEIDVPAKPAPTNVNDRLGWRVYLLPYLFQDELSRRFRPNEPWDSANNLPLSARVIPEYADRETPHDPTTRIRCFYDNGAAFDTKKPIQPYISNPNHSLSQTILFVEGGEKVPWTRFQEYKFDPNGPLPTLGKPGTNGYRAVMGDGSVRWIRKDADPEVVKALIVRRGQPVRPHVGDEPRRPEVGR